MPQNVETLLAHIRELQDSLQDELEQKRDKFRYRLDRGRIRFESRALARHRALKVTLLTFLRNPRPLFILTAPFIYGLIVPLVLLDLCVALYQAICFPVYGIAKVRRADHVVIDRHQLAYLNGLQKLNCVYCGYANGVIAWAREVASRTEQYWCPIKHARRVADPHTRYGRFVDFGDAEGFQQAQPTLREDLREGP
ncbi:hypothetical protein [Rhodovulum adriaticum]|uniref:Uncharacterized protein n=1 Tax=Rhodovulum adriaticum TaxID=35804 RepID=A0A4R2NLB4_RHOAD|nr:hypothetical protein [Rhodovulum adriaticum]MBK1635198.1 hypothetical protein [Rhodovulum adriaticum]TCP22311.1 hypothetical protein EV656_107121 [Rhodovulum adriaticum]